MPETSLDLQNHLKTLLQSNLDRGTLLRELQALTQVKAFRELAVLWAPALYARDVQFFETFLLRHLDGRRHVEVIRALLPRVEAAGHDSLFQGLYRKVADEAAWDKELLALAQSRDSDEHVLRAVQRRDMQRAWFSLTEETALALYQRNPALISEFVRSHVRWRWREQNHFRRLRDEAKRQGDDELYWFLFREFAEASEWTEELRQLLRRDIPADQISDELQKRHPSHLWWVSERSWGSGVGILIDFLEKHRADVLPYLERNLAWIGQFVPARLLRAVEQLGDETLYWRIFFKVVYYSPMWNDALRDLLKRPLSDEGFLIEIQRRTPPAQRWSGWQLDGDVALAIYRRSPTQLRPFLEQFVLQPDVALFEEAQRADDDEFLDFLTFRFLLRLSSLTYSAFPHQWARWINQGDVDKAQHEIEAIARPLLARFDRLYAQSPETYVRHAANILSRFRSFEIWSVKRQGEHNPVFVYLASRHCEAWRQSPDGIRELLESPNIYIQIVGLNMLGEGGADAAQRVVENLLVLRALLLGRARRNTKKKVVQCLEAAARQGPEFARQILPILGEAIDFRGKRAIDERILVSFVRLRHGLAAPGRAQVVPA